MEINKIYCENNLDTMKRMPDNSVDLIVTSPPYNFNLRIHSGKYTKRSVNEVTKYNKAYSDNLGMQEYYEWQKECIEQMLRVCKNYVFYNIQMLTGNKVALFKLMGYFAENIKEVLIWDKVFAEPAISKGVLNSQYEYVIVFSKNKAISRMFEVCNFKRGTEANIIKIPKNMSNGNSKTHNACFPEELPYWVINMFSNTNDIIYDPFAGTGTTIRMAIILGRRWVGSEINAEYCRLIQDGIHPLLNNLFVQDGKTEC